MSIAVECECGRAFQVADDKAGRKVRCPACQELVEVPGEAEEAHGYVMESVRKCPGCKAEWPGETVLCTKCGHNFETGKRTKRKLEVKTLELGAIHGLMRTAVTVRRDRQGKTSVTVRKYLLFFLPIGSRVYKLSDFNAVVTDFAAGDEEAPDTFCVDLEGPRVPAVPVYRGSNSEALREVIEALQALGNLEVKRR